MSVELTRYYSHKYYSKFFFNDYQHQGVIKRRTDGGIFGASLGLLWASLWILGLFGASSRRIRSSHEASWASWGVTCLFTSSLSGRLLTTPWIRYKICENLVKLSFKQFEDVKKTQLNRRTFRNLAVKFSISVCHSRRNLWII